jgi:hypothetical protein
MISGTADEGVKRPFGLLFSAVLCWAGGAAVAGGGVGLIVSVRILVCASVPALARSVSARKLRQMRSSMARPPFRAAPV